MNTKKLILFGSNTYASMFARTIKFDTNHRLAAFTVDSDYITSKNHEGSPLYDFSEIQSKLVPHEHIMILPLGYADMNQVRENRYKQAKLMGYEIGSYVSSRASTWPDLSVLENVIIFEQSIIQPYVSIGANVTIRAGSNLGHHTRVGENSFIAAGVITGGNVKIGKNCFIGLGAVIRDGVTIADYSLIGAGSVVIADTEPNSVYVGNPARKLPPKS